MNATQDFSQMSVEHLQSLLESTKEQLDDLHKTVVLPMRKRRSELKAQRKALADALRKATTGKNAEERKAEQEAKRTERKAAREAKQAERDFSARRGLPRLGGNTPEILIILNRQNLRNLEDPYLGIVTRFMQFNPNIVGRNIKVVRAA